MTTSAFGGRHRLDASDHDPGRSFQIHPPGGFPQERRFPSVRFDQDDVDVGPHCRQDQSRETAPLPRSASLWPGEGSGGKLGRSPRHGGSRRPLPGPADQVDGLLPAAQGRPNAPAGRVFHVKHRRRAGPSRAGTAPGRPGCGSSGRPAADMLQERDQGRRRDARDAGGLAQGGWLVLLELLADFIG